MKNIVFLLPSCTTGTRKCYVVRILYAISFQWSKCFGYRGQQIGLSCTSDPGADPEGGAPGARPPKIGRNMIFWRKIVIFHTKYPQNFRASLRSALFFKCAPLNLKSRIRP